MVPVNLGGTLIFMERLQEAIAWAVELHRGQWRDGESPLPYITHPLDVLAKTRYIAGVTDEDMLCAAVLHDTFEECGTQPRVIAKKFGKITATLVEELTRTEPTPDQIQGLDKDQIWKLRSEFLLKDIETQMSREAHLIKLADRLSNLEEAERVRTGKKRTRYLGQTQQILDIIPRRVSPELWDAISNLVATADRQPA